jgi:hypothetical protein
VSVKLVPVVDRQVHDTGDTLADLTDLAHRGVIRWVLPVVPVGTGYTIGTRSGPVLIQPEAADAFITTAAQAGAWAHGQVPERRKGKQ